MALDPLGVEVTIWREDATDEQGNPLPRWSLTMTPFDPDILYGDTPRAPPLQIERSHHPLAIEVIDLGDGVAGGGKETEGEYVVPPCEKRTTTSINLDGNEPEADA